MQPQHAKGKNSEFTQKNDNAPIIGIGDKGMLRGTDGDDKLISGPTVHEIQAYDGDDMLIGGPTNDYLAGADGSNKLNGGPGDDWLYGGGYSEGDSAQVIAGPGDDRISGGEGDDRLIGGSGNDDFNGYQGDDLMVGGAGEDTFNFDTLYRDNGDDVIKDFKVGEDDLNFEASYDISVSQEGNSAIVSYSGETTTDYYGNEITPEGSVTLVGVDVNQVEEMMIS